MFTARRWILYSLIALTVLLATCAVWAAGHWPFTKQAVTLSLEQRIAGHVEFGSFRKTYFPPGAVAQNVKVTQNGATLIAARNLIITTGYGDLLAHRVSRIKIVGLQVSAPEGSSPVLRDSGQDSPVTVGQLEVNQASVDIGHGPLTIHQLVVTNLKPGAKVGFRTSFRLDRLLAEISSQGTVGPWNEQNSSATPVSGTYRLQNGDLKVFRNLKGTLSSQGQFAGNFSTVDTAGSVDVNDFRVDGSAHTVRLTTIYQASVDARTGNVILRQSESHVGRTAILARGTITGDKPFSAKTARLDFTVNSGRVEDLLNYFSEEKRASMTGAVRLTAHAEIPPGPGFLKKIRVRGDFGVAAGKFVTPKTQRPLDDLSASARGEDPKKEEKAGEDIPSVVSNLKGHVDVNNGTALLKNVSFEFPGSLAEMSGTFNLIPKTVDIQGTLRTSGSLPDTASGVKALLLKVVTPFMKKQGVTVVPFAIRGTSSHPSISLDLHDRKKF